METATMSCERLTRLSRRIARNRIFMDAGRRSHVILPLATRSNDAITHQSSAPPPPPPDVGVGPEVELGGDAAEPVTATVIEADADRFAPSTAATVTVTVPPG